MPSTTCPSCGFRVEFGLYELNAEFTCRKCQAVFTPFGGIVGRQAPEPAPQEFPAVSASQPEEDYPPTQSLKPGTMLAGSLIIVAVFLIVVLGMILGVTAIGRNSGSPAVATPSPKSAPSPPPKPVPSAPSPVPSTPSVEDTVAASAAVGFFVGIWGLLCVLSVAYVVCVILLLAWVAKDCRARGVDGGAVWILVILFTHWVGLIVYLVSRPHGILVPCIRCGNKRLMATRMCPHCGEAFA